MVLAIDIFRRTRRGRSHKTETPADADRDRQVMSWILNRIVLVIHQRMILGMTKRVEHATSLPAGQPSECCGPKLGDII